MQATDVFGFSTLGRALQYVCNPTAFINSQSQRGLSCTPQGAYGVMHFSRVKDERRASQLADASASAGGTPEDAGQCDRITGQRLDIYSTNSGQLLDTPCVVTRGRGEQTGSTSIALREQSDSNPEAVGEQSDSSRDAVALQSNCSRNAVALQSDCSLRSGTGNAPPR